MQVEMLSYFPDFEFDEDGEPRQNQKSQIIRHLSLKCLHQIIPEGEISFVAIKQTIEPYGNNQNKMTFKGVETKNVSGLTVRKDLTLWIISSRWIYFYGRGYTRILLESSSHLDSSKER